MFINIYSKGSYPANMLSNFAPHSFDFDSYKGIQCMEAFLQSLKFQDAPDQQRVLYMTAKEAKYMVAKKVGTDTYTGKERR